MHSALVQAMVLPQKGIIETASGLLTSVGKLIIVAITVVALLIILKAAHSSGGAPAAVVVAVLMAAGLVWAAKNLDFVSEMWNDEVKAMPAPSQMVDQRLAVGPYGLDA